MAARSALLSSNQEFLVGDFFFGGPEILCARDLFLLVGGDGDCGFVIGGGRGVFIAVLKSADAEAYEQALALYEGDLLTEDLYEDWTTTRRESLRALHYELLLKLAQLYERKQQYQQSIARLKELLDCDPANEEVHRALMRLYALTGHRHQALRQYQQCAATMRRELAAEPDRETIELHRQIESGRIQPLPPGATPGRPVREQAAIESIAILPLANLTADANMEYLSDGITENIINRLSQLLVASKISARSVPASTIACDGLEHGGPLQGPGERAV